jgi:hypothetical protein
MKTGSQKIINNDIRKTVTKKFVTATKNEEAVSKYRRMAFPLLRDRLFLAMTE